MLNYIIKFSLANRLIVLATTLMVLAIGSYIAFDMDVDVFPDLTAPTVTVITEAHGMSTEEVEQLVTFPIESSLNGAPFMRRIRSSTAMGYSIVWAEFEWGTDIYKARQIVAEKISSIKANLPNEVESPILAPISSIMGEIMMIGLSSDSISPMELRSMSDWIIRPQLLSINGVAQAIVMGGEYKQYQVLASPEKLKYFGVSLHELEEAVASSTSNVSGGFYNQYGNQYVIKAEGRTNDIKQIGLNLIKLEDGVPIRVKDVAEIKIAAAPKIGEASVMAENAIILTVLKQPNANTLKLTEQIDERLIDIQKQLPSSLNIDSNIFRQSTFIDSSINNLQKTLLEGAIFVSIVLFIFLMNWRTTIISVIAIPVSLIVTIIILKLLGITINTMSLGGMAIAIGSLVDDAIIDVENIFKRLRENMMKPVEKRTGTFKVIYEASSEIRNSILIATLIIITAFVPLFFLSGMEGRLLQPLGISFIIAIFTSLFVAITLTPVLSSYLLAKESRLNKNIKASWVERNLRNIYKRILDVVLTKTRLILFSTVILFAISIYLLTGLGRSFLPEFNEGALVISVVTPPGISLEESNKTGNLVEELLQDIKEITKTSRRTGRAELDEHAQGVNSSEVEVLFELKDVDQQSFLEEVRTKLSIVPGANITIGQPISHRIDHMLSGTRANIAIKLFGTGLNDLFTIANEIKGEIEDIEGLTDLNVEQQIEVPQLRILPNRVMLSKYGIKLGEFMEIVNTALEGKKVAQVYEGQRKFDLIVRYPESYRNSEENIRNILIDTPDGQKIPLQHIAEVSVSETPFSVSRENVQRKIVVSANVAGRDLRSTVNEIRSTINENIALPENYFIQYGGQFESEEKATRMLLLTSIAALIIIFFLLFSEFRDLRLAAVVLINLPLALIGGVCIVYFTSGIISIASTIGFISLFGIAARNGILLVSKYQDLLKKGRSLKETIVDGSLDRLNPILMTALTTGLALIPLAFAGNESGNEIQSPMAIVILGGLLSSTFLNLIVIPVVFNIMKTKKQ